MAARRGPLFVDSDQAAKLREAINPEIIFGGGVTPIMGTQDVVWVQCGERSGYDEESVYFLATIQLWNASTDAWEGFGDVWLKTPDGDDLVASEFYGGILYGSHTEGEGEESETLPVVITWGTPAVEVGCGLQQDETSLIISVKTSDLVGCGLQQQPGEGCRIAVKTRAVEVVTGIECVEGELVVSTDTIFVVDEDCGDLD